MSAALITLSRPKTHIFWIIAIGTGTLFRLAQGIWDNPLDHLFSDPARHWDNATHFLQPSLMGGCDPLLYQVYLFLLQKLTVGHQLAVGIASGLLSATMPWIYYRAARSLDLDRSWALAMWGIMVWTPSFLGIYRYFMMETILLPLIGLGLWMTGRAYRKRSLGAYQIAVFVWLLAIMTKAQAVPAAAVCLGYGLYALPRRFILPAVSSGLFLAILMLIPGYFRSEAVLQYPAPLGSGYIAKIMHAGGTTHTRFHWNGNTWIYSSPSCYIAPLEPVTSWRIHRGQKETFRDVTINREQGRSSWDDALHDAQQNTGVSIRSWAENIVLFLFAPSWPDSGKDHAVGWLNHHLRWMWAPLIALVAVENATLFAARRFALVPVLVSTMLIIFMFQNSVTMEGRYRKPIEPLLILNALWLCAGPRDFRRPGQGA